MIVGGDESLPKPPTAYRKVPVAPAVNDSVLDDKSAITSSSSSSDEENGKDNDEEIGKTIVTKLPDVMSCNEGALPKVEPEKVREMAEVSLTRDEKLKAEAKSLYHKLHHLPKIRFVKHA